MKTDDPQQPSRTLTITGMVENVVTINPKIVRLVGTADTETSAQVSIVPEKKYAFKITGLRAKDGRHVTLDLKETIEADITKYVLTVTNKKQQKARYYDLIYLKTDSPVRPELVINVYGNILETVRGKVN